MMQLNHLSQCHTISDQHFILNKTNHIKSLSNQMMAYQTIVSYHTTRVLSNRIAEKSISKQIIPDHLCDIKSNQIMLKHFNPYHIISYHDIKSYQKNGRNAGRALHPLRKDVSFGLSLMLVDLKGKWNWPVLA